MISIVDIDLLIERWKEVDEFVRHKSELARWS
jgi:hypothetical protein